MQQRIDNVVDKPGVYDLPHAVYHSQCTPEPALSSTGARQIVQECPAWFWWHSELNPARPRVENRAFDIGSAKHILTLEPHAFANRVALIDAADYRTNVAKNERDDARDAGLIPLLPDELDLVKRMRDSVFAHPVARHAFDGADREKTFIARDPMTYRWQKARPDAVPHHRRYQVELKTAASANPGEFARSIARFGYHQQAAWYIDVTAAAEGSEPAMRFAFVVVSKAEPHLVSVVWLDPEDIGRGRALNQQAMAAFHRCASAGWEREHWPGYQDDEAASITQPGWAQHQQDEMIARAIAYQAPLEGDVA